MKPLNFFKKQEREPLEPVLIISIIRDGRQIDRFTSADSAEKQRRNMSNLVSIFERYKAEIIHRHADGEILIIIDKKKNDIFYPDEGGENKNSKKEG